MRNPSDEFLKCLSAVNEICKEKNFTEAELQHRARILYLLNKLDFWNDVPVLLEEFKHQRTLSPKKTGKPYTEIQLERKQNLFIFIQECLEQCCGKQHNEAGAIADNYIKGLKCVLPEIPTHE